MNIVDFAKLLDGRAVRHEISHKEGVIAKELGFVVVFGASDDCVEFRGAIDDEMSAYGVTYFDDEGILDYCTENCKFYQKAEKSAKKIKAIWCGDDGWCWTYETDIPHATFGTYEGDEGYCKGIIFDIKSLK